MNATNERWNEIDQTSGKKVKLNQRNIKKHNKIGIEKKARIAKRIWNSAGNSADHVKSVTYVECYLNWWYLHQHQHKYILFL